MEEEANTIEEEWKNKEVRIKEVTKRIEEKRMGEKNKIEGKVGSGGTKSVGS